MRENHRSDPINSSKTFLTVLIRSQQLQQNPGPILFEQNPRWVLGLLGFVDFAVSLWLLFLIIGEEEYLEMGCYVWLFKKKIFWKWVCCSNSFVIIFRLSGFDVIFASSMFFVVFFCCWVSTKIESVRLDFNLTENESNGLKFSIPKSSLLHSRC